MPQAKDGQLQIRVSAAEKKAIRQAAARAGMDTSSWVRARLLPPAREAFRLLIASLPQEPGDRAFLLAAINDLLTPLAPAELRRTVDEAPPPLEPYLANYVAAMVETPAHRAGIAPPGWTGQVPPLTLPSFGTDLPGLRFHLMVSSPPAFRRRNIFVDATIGDRV